ncbi:P-loop containing nucleoside triphosphate hydrolase protein [Kockovaella imperatae]|uniref:p-loop containing nucleoside triphosphate hydrolase protein n=1 Tax=Kockovaella imperatae TaxID=4999 RepID=A0A1Y1UCJ6_9TREE|nr:P-loop containing nucleoside triphosphate hydrolase protein [Kockovaella imperatae]ORX35778.1 P-loop containing nucleoside triphosphate hydrolase protein [Kockovaella imperatae]
MSIKVNALPLSSRIKAALIEAKYVYVDELADLSSEDLCSELGLTRVEVQQLQRIAAGEEDDPDLIVTAPSKATASTATALLNDQRLSTFNTGCEVIDDLIYRTWSRSSELSRGNTTVIGNSQRDQGGSIVPGMTLEVSGPPGGGKTALVCGIIISALSIAPDEEAESAGQILVVDTEGGFTPERILNAWQTDSRSRSTDNIREVLSRVHLVRVITQLQMIAFINSLDSWLENHPHVNLVIIDSLSYHFRQPNLDSKSRNRILEIIKAQIAKATTLRRCAVIVTNQLATKLLTTDNKPANFDTGDRAILMPQLGDAWLGGKTVRMVLFRGGAGDEQRYAHATLSQSAEGGCPWVKFDIDPQGTLCDPP